jgi:hypothetical protein
MDRQTRNLLIYGLAFGLLINVGPISHSYGLDWSFANTWIFGVLHIAHSYFITLFHAWGHALFGWVYGQIAIPVFDLTYFIGDQWLPIGDFPILKYLFWIGLSYFSYWLWPQSRSLAISVAVFVTIVILTSFNDEAVQAMGLIGGPLAEPIVASFFLYRGLFNLTPRGIAERFLNFGFGFSLFIGAFVHATANVFIAGREAERRLVGEIASSVRSFTGKEDFSTLADIIPGLNFQGASALWLATCVIFLILPFAHYWNKKIYGEFNL